MNQRAGTYRKILRGEAHYLSFVPAPLPPVPPVALSEDIVSLLVGAHKQLTLLNALSDQIPSMALFVSMYVRKEALLSSQIEGTQLPTRKSSYTKDLMNLRRNERLNS